MSIFADMDTMSSIRGLSTEANQRSVNDLFEHIKSVCSDPRPLSGILDRIVSGDNITDNIDRIMNPANNVRTLDINTHPHGGETDEVFPYMHAIFRYGARLSTFANALSKYSHKPNTIGGEEKTILITTDFCNTDFIDKIEDTLADVYFTGKLAVIIVLFTDHGVSDIPFYMNYRWHRSNSKLMKIEEVISALGSPIIYEEQEYSFRGPGKTRSYSITINSIKDTEIKNTITGNTKIVKGRTARRFIEKLWLFSDNAPMDIGSFPLDKTKYSIHFLNRDYNGLYPSDSESQELIGIFEDLIGNF